MPHLAPFRAIRFASEGTAPDGMSPVDGICPPYDVIDANQHQSLLDHHDHNAVRWVLGHDPSAPKGNESEYRRRGDEFRQWLEAGVLTEDPERSLYLYRMEFRDHTGRPMQYRGVIGALEAAEWGSRGVFPHEEVHTDVVEDRLRLLEASGVDTGVVQIVVDGRDGEWARLQDEAAAKAELLFEGEGPDGARHTVHRLRRGEAQQAICEWLEPRDSVIADGHHRYTTLLEFGCRRGAANTPYVLAAVGDLFQEGLDIYPTHRLVTWNGTQSSGKSMAPGDLIAHLREALHDGEGQEWALQMRDGEKVAMQSRNDHPDTLARRLRDALGSALGELHIANYHHDPAAAEALAASTGSALLCWLPPVTREEFWQRTTRQEVFPPKTTYFLPKISTGIAARWLHGSE